MRIFCCWNQNIWGGGLANIGGVCPPGTNVEPPLGVRLPPFPFLSLPFYFLSPLFPFLSPPFLPPFPFPLPRR